MVVFTCNNCGDSVQKPRVEKHLLQCKKRGPTNLCCVDCLKDFRGEAYKEHTKCVSEAQRYGGLNYVPKASANKGEVKQSSWIDNVRIVLENGDISGTQRKLLNDISSYDNIPRKKARFVNFIKSTLPACRFQTDIVEGVFELLEKEFAKNNPPNVKKSESKGDGKMSEVKTEITKETPTEEQKSKKKKMKAKDGVAGSENQENQNSLSVDTIITNGNEEQKSKKKKKKSKDIGGESENQGNQESSPVDTTITTNGHEEQKSKKEKKKTKDGEIGSANQENQESSPVDTTITNGDEEQKSKKEKKKTKDGEIGSANQENQESSPVDTTITNCNEEEQKPKRKRKRGKDVDAGSGNQENQELPLVNVTTTKEDVEEQKPKKKKKAKHEANSVNQESSPFDNSTTSGNNEMSKSNATTEEPKKKKNGNKRKLENNDDDKTEITAAKEVKLSENTAVKTQVQNTEGVLNESTNFDWEGTIRNILEKSSDKEISIKKMTKKLVSKYREFYTDSSKTGDEIIKTFQKKMKKLACIELSDEKVKLIS